MPIQKNEQMILEVAKNLPSGFRDKVVFLGGSVVSLLITEPAFIGIRPTKDVDMIIDTNRKNYHKLEAALQAKGFKQVMDEDPPVICRWRINSVLVDVMPCDSAILGFSNKWYGDAIKHAQKRLVEDVEINLVTAPYFLATKIEAFLGRGNNDFMASSDMEDIIVLLDGRSKIISEIKTSDKSLKAFLAKTFTTWLSTKAFLDALPGHLPPDAASQERLPLIIDRLKTLANL